MRKKTTSRLVKKAMIFAMAGMLAASSPAIVFAEDGGTEDSGGSFDGGGSSDSADREESSSVNEPNPGNKGPGSEATEAKKDSAHEAQESAAEARENADNAASAAQDVKNDADSAEASAQTASDKADSAATQAAEAEGRVQDAQTEQAAAEAAAQAATDLEAQVETNAQVVKEQAKEANIQAGIAEQAAMDAQQASDDTDALMAQKETDLQELKDDADAYNANVAEAQAIADEQERIIKEEVYSTTAEGAVTPGTDIATINDNLATVQQLKEQALNELDETLVTDGQERKNNAATVESLANQAASLYNEASSALTDAQIKLIAAIKAYNIQAVKYNLPLYDGTVYGTAAYAQYIADNNLAGVVAAIDAVNRAQEVYDENAEIQATDLSAFETIVNNAQTTYTAAESSYNAAKATAEDALNTAKQITGNPENARQMMSRSADAEVPDTVYGQANEAIARAEAANAAADAAKTAADAAIQDAADANQAADDAATAKNQAVADKGIVDDYVEDTQEDAEAAEEAKEDTVRYYQNMVQDVIDILQNQLDNTSNPFERRRLENNIRIAQNEYNSLKAQFDAAEEDYEENLSGDTYEERVARLNRITAFIDYLDGEIDRMKSWTHDQRYRQDLIRAYNMITEYQHDFWDYLSVYANTDAQKALADARDSQQAAADDLQRAKNASERAEAARLIANAADQTAKSAKAAAEAVKEAVKDIPDDMAEVKKQADDAVGEAEADFRGIAGIDGYQQTIRDAKQNIMNANERLTEMKRLANIYAQLDELELKALFNAIQTAEIEVAEAEQTVETIKTISDTIQRYSGYASMYAGYVDGDYIYTSAYIATAQDGAFRQLSDYPYSLGDGNGDLEDVTFSDVEKSTVVVPETVLQKYLQGIAAYERDNTQGFPDEAGNGVFIGRTVDGARQGGSMPILYWELNADGTLSDTYYTSTTQLAPGTTYYVAFSFKGEEDEFALDGVYLTTEEETTSGGGRRRRNRTNATATATTTIGDEGVPLAVVDIGDEDTPLAATPEVTIDEEGTPLANALPFTGDKRLPVFPFALAGAAAIGTGFFLKKKAEDNKEEK